MNDLISRHAAIDAICNDWCGTSNADCKNPFDPATDDYYHCDGCGDVELIKALPSADVQILSSLLEELTHKERTDRYHVWTTHEVKQWFEDKITEMKNDG